MNALLPPSDGQIDKLADLLAWLEVQDKPALQAMLDAIRKSSADAREDIAEAIRVKADAKTSVETERRALEQARSDFHVETEKARAEHASAMAVREGAAVEREKAATRQEQALDRRSADLDAREKRLNARIVEIQAAVAA